jgi:hypothetical protein
MLDLVRAIKPWKEAAALSDHINLYGFWNETAFLTKSGDLGMVLSIDGVDYESLDHAEQEYAVKRLEAALKSFGPGFHVYQYLFKTNRPEIPFASYDDPVVQTAVDQRRQFFDQRADRLYRIEIFYCVVIRHPRMQRFRECGRYLRPLVVRVARRQFGVWRRGFSAPKNPLAMRSMKRLPSVSLPCLSGHTLRAFSGATSPHPAKNAGRGPRFCGTSPLCFPDSSPKASLGPFSRKRCSALGSRAPRSGFANG